MLGCPSAGKYTERRLWLTENRRFPRGKAHVACQYELAAGGPYATFNLCDRDEAACTQMPKEESY